MSDRPPSELLNWPGAVEADAPDGGVAAGQDAELHAFHVRAAVFANDAAEHGLVGIHVGADERRRSRSLGLGLCRGLHRAAPSESGLRPHGRASISLSANVRNAKWRPATTVSMPCCDEQIT